MSQTTHLKSPLVNYYTLVWFHGVEQLLVGLPHQMLDVLGKG